MVDVGEKPITRRECVARGAVQMARETLAAIAEGRTPKGDVLAVARIAGLQAAKRTAEWIPLAHPAAARRCRNRTGRPISPARASRSKHACAPTRARASRWKRSSRSRRPALTVYDMCKAIDRGMSLDAVRLVQQDAAARAANGTAASEAAAT